MSKKIHKISKKCKQNISKSVADDFITNNNFNDNNYIFRV